MMKYRIQKVDFFSDQYEDKGQISSEEAIEVFQSFPFDQQFAEMRNRKMTSCFPKIIFERECGAFLTIYAENEDGFYFKYENTDSESDFFISNNYNPNSVEGKETPEDIIDFFVSNRLESKLSLRSKKNIEDDNNQTIKYKYRKRKEYKHWAWAILFILSTGTLALFVDEMNMDIALYVYAFFSLYWLPSLVLFFSFYLKNRNATVTIDKVEKTLSYEDSNARITFNRDDIKKCEINRTRAKRKFSNAFKYLWIVLKDNKEVLITNFIAEPENIIEDLNLHYSIDKRVVPFLPIKSGRR
ncbi:MAG: hypothetical protein ACEPOZ_07135 [Marinifilaceae bacterium]